MSNNKSFFIFSVFSFLVVTACQVDNLLIHRCWIFVDRTDANSLSKNGLNTASFLCLNKDGTYTRDLGTFDYGQYKYKDNVLVMNSQIGHQKTMHVISVSLTDMYIDLGNGNSADFQGHSIPTKKGFENPFSVQNNRWRIPALTKEDDLSLRNRLANHCQFWSAYFSWAFNSNQELVDVRNTPTPIKIYHNGFVLEPFEDESDHWKSLFHDQQDTRKAYDLLRAIFVRHDIAWSHTENKYQMFAGAFQQLANDLK